MSESLAKSHRSIAIMMAMLATSVVALLLFAWLTEEVFENEARGVDLSVRAAVHHLASPTLTATMSEVSLLGSYGLAVLFVVAMLGFWMARRRRAAVLLLLCMAGALVLNISLKFAFNRARPQAFFGTDPHTPSFPSGHALMSFCFYFVIAGLLASRSRSNAVRVAIWAIAALIVVAVASHAFTWVSTIQPMSLPATLPRPFGVPQLSRLTGCNTSNSSGRSCALPSVPPSQKRDSVISTQANIYRFREGEA
jgi:hypothetical protein